jgi:hypothetical protein
LLERKGTMEVRRLKTFQPFEFIHLVLPATRPRS